MFKKSLCLLLIILMLCSTFPATVLAETLTDNISAEKVSNEELNEPKLDDMRQNEEILSNKIERRNNIKEKDEIKKEKIFNKKNYEETDDTKMSTMSFESAVPITIGQVVEDSIQTPGEVDYFSFTPAQSDTYIIYTKGNIDTVGKLYEGDNYLDDNDDGGTDNNFAIVYNLVAGKTYNVEVELYDNNETGDYSITVEKCDTKDISGLVSLPNSEVAPTGGIEVRIYVSGDAWAYETVNIEEGKNSATYSITVPITEEIHDYYVYYSIYSENADYVHRGYYNTTNTVYKSKDKTYININQNNTTNINLELNQGIPISGQVFLPNEEVVSREQGICLDIDADGDYYFSDSVTIHKNQNYASYTVVVPNTGKKEEYEIGYDLDDNDITDYVRQQDDIRTIIVNGNAIDNIDITLIPGVSITGTISLPEGEVAPAEGTYIIISAMGDSYYSTEITIDSGQNYANYILTVPEPSESDAYKIRYYSWELDESKYIDTGYYSITGTVENSEDATLVEVHTEKIMGIDLDIITTNLIYEGYVHPNETNIEFRLWGSFLEEDIDTLVIRDLDTSEDVVSSWERRSSGDHWGYEFRSYRCQIKSIYNNGNGLKENKTYQIELTRDNDTVSTSLITVYEPIIECIDTHEISTDSNKIFIAIESDDIQDIYDNNPLFKLVNEQGKTVYEEVSKFEIGHDNYLKFQLVNATELQNGDYLYLRPQIDNSLYLSEIETHKFYKRNGSIIINNDWEKFKESIEDTSNQNYKFVFYGYNILDKEYTVSLKNKNGELITTLTETGEMDENGLIERIVFKADKNIVPQGDYDIWFAELGGRGTYHIDRDTSTQDKPILKNITEYYGVIQGIAENSDEIRIECMDGTLLKTPERFSTSKYVNRAEMSKIIANAINIDSYDSQEVHYLDIDNNHWAADSIKSVSIEGIMSGYGDGTFRPQACITRAELAKIIYEAFDIPYYQASEPMFPDVPGWAREAVESLANAGLINGYPDGTFRPDGGVHIDEAITVIIRAMGIDESNLLWPTGYITVAYEYGLFDGVTDVFSAYTVGVDQVRVKAIKENGTSAELVVDITYRDCDFNKDGEINLTDLNDISYHYGTVLGDGNFDEKYDLNSDGIVNIYDLVIVASQINQ